MKKRALIFILASPIIYLYGLLENHFSFGATARGYTLEFLYEYVNGWRVIFGGEYKDKSVAVATYDYKVKAKKTKFDVDIALLMKELYGSHWIRFDKKKRNARYNWSGDYGNKTLNIEQLGKDEFKMRYYDDSSWSNRLSISTDYVFTKDEVIVTLNMIKDMK